MLPRMHCPRSLNVLRVGVLMDCKPERFDSLHLNQARDKPKSPLKTHGVLARV